MTDKPGPHHRSRLSRRNMLLGTTTAAAAMVTAQASAQTTQSTTTTVGPVTAATGSKPNIIMIVSDDFGYGDAGVYLGGEARGMPTPNIDRLANEGMMFTSFYAQPSCTPGRAAMQTGRIPNRSGMTTVAFQGQGGGLPAAEWTLASVLKTAGYKTFFLRQVASRRSGLRAA
jgi:phosphoglycerol transferase MdoB-like AlkP superfamily enzyme